MSADSDDVEDDAEHEQAFDDVNKYSQLEVRERQEGPRRDYAHELLDYWLDKSKTKHWKYLNKKWVRNGLHNRISHPNWIKQGPTGLCGPAAFMRALAREDPCEFALFGGMLYSFGYANLGQHGRIFKKVAPRAQTKWSILPPRMAHSDWLVLASLRDAFNVHPYHWDAFNQINGMSVGSVSDFFRTAGYSRVVENLGGSGIFKGGVNKGLENIDKANWHFRHGYHVLLLVDSQILKTPDPGGSIVANHWIGLTSMIDVNLFWKRMLQNPVRRIGVRIPEVWSWGQKQPIPPYLEYLSYEDFTKCYYGFVAAKAEQ